MVSCKHSKKKEKLTVYAGKNEMCCDCANAQFEEELKNDPEFKKYYDKVKAMALKTKGG